MGKFETGEVLEPHYQELKDSKIKQSVQKTMENAGFPKDTKYSVSFIPGQYLIIIEGYKGFRGGVGQTISLIRDTDYTRENGITFTPEGIANIKTVRQSLDSAITRHLAGVKVSLSELHNEVSPENISA